MKRLPTEAEGRRWFGMKRDLAVSRPVQALLLMVTFVCFTIPFFIRSLDKADTLKPSWASAEIWIRSADCARATGAVLAICKNGKLVPIADDSAGDDPGQALALDLYSILTQKTATQNDVSRLNSILNYTGIALLAACLFFLRLPVGAFLLLTGSALIANQFHSLGPHPGQFGVACLVAILPLSILAFPFGRLSGKAAWFWFPVGVLGLDIGMMFREAIGLMGVVAALLAVSVGYFRSTSKTLYKAVVAAGLAGAIFLSVVTPQMILRVRDSLFDMRPSARMEQHGVWHNLYIGLGAVKNPFGIEWSDTSGIEAVRKVDPSISYLSNEYFSVLRHEYFRIVMSHPVEVGKIYLEKLAIAANTYGTWEIMFAVVIVAAILRLQRRIVGEWHSGELLLFVSICFVVMFLGQAILFHYSPQYLFPIKLFLLLSVGALLELLSHARYLRRSEQGLAAMRNT